MKALLSLVAFFVLCSLVPVSHQQPPVVLPDDVSYVQTPGGRCILANESAALGYHIPALCFNYITYNYIYVDDYTNNKTLLAEYQAASTTTVGSCLFDSFQLVCAGFNRPCYDVPVPDDLQGPGIPETIPVGAYACRTLCMDRRESCTPVLLALGVKPDDTSKILACDRPVWKTDWGVPNRDIFPEQRNYTVSLLVPGTSNYFNATLDCYDDNRYVLGGLLPLVCPEGMYLDDDVCVFDCPEPLIKESEYDAVEFMLNVVGWISFLTLLFLTASYLADPDKRKFPAILPLFFIVSTMLLSFSLCIGSFVGHRNVWCEDDRNANEFGDPACTVQGILYVYFTLAGALWWLSIACNLLFVVFGVKATRTVTIPFTQGFQVQVQTIIQIAFHSCCWLLPILPLIISLSAERLGFGGSDLWCTIHSGGRVEIGRGALGVSAEGKETNLYNLLLLTLPVLLIMFVGDIVLIVVIVYGCWKSKQGWKYFLSQWRLFAFLLLYVWTYVFVFSFQIHFETEKQDQYQAYEDYITCLIFNTRDSGRDPDVCSLDYVLSFPLWFIVAFNVAAQGFFVFLIFGTTPSVYTSWYRLFRRVVLRDYSSSSSDSSKGPATKLKVLGKKLGDKSINLHMTPDSDLTKEGEGGEGGDDDEISSSASDTSSEEEGEDYVEDRWTQEENTGSQRRRDSAAGGGGSGRVDGVLAGGTPRSGDDDSAEDSDSDTDS